MNIVQVMVNNYLDSRLQSIPHFNLDKNESAQS